MAYEKTLWKDRVVEKPNTYRTVENPDGTITLYPITGQVIEKGTPISAANLNKIENGIVEVYEHLDNMAIEIEKPISLNRCDSEMLGAIQNKEGETSFNLLSIPRNKSVTPIKTNFMSCNLVNVFDFSNYNGFSNNEPISIKTVDDGLEVECNGMCGVFYKFNTTIGNKYTIKFKRNSTSTNLNIRAFNNDKTVEIVRTTLINDYFIATFTATTTESNIRIWSVGSFTILEAKVYEGTDYNEIWHIDIDKIPPITKDKIESVGIEQLDFVSKKASETNLIDNEKIVFLNESNDRFEVPITLMKKEYKLFCRNYGSNLYITIKDLNGTIVQTISDNALFNGNSGFKFTSTLEGDYILNVQVINASLEKTKGNWTLNEKEIILADNSYNVNYNFDGIKLDVNSVDFIKNYNIKPKLWKKGQNINNGGAMSPDSSKKWFYAEEILPDTYYYLSPNTLNPLAFYDEKGNYIKWLSIDSTLNSKDMIIFKTPVNARYVQGVAEINKDLSNMVFCPTLNKDRVSLEEANKDIINPKLFTQKHRKTRYEGMKLTTDGDSLVAMSRWQQRVVDNTGLILLKNCGVGGSKVSSMCSDERVAEIPSDTEVLILWAGANDWGQTNFATPMGDINSPHDNTTYYGAYQLWLDKIYAKLPNAIILICIQSHRDGEEIPNHLGYTLEDYRVATREIAYKYGYPTVDLMANMGANNNNHYDFFEDVVHINDKGSKKAAELIVGKLLSIEPFDI